MFFLRLNCEEKFYSLNSRGGIEKIEIATLPTIWRENENQVNPGVQSLFLLLSKGERDMVNCFPESFPPDKVFILFYLVVLNAFCLEPKITFLIL